MEGPKERVARRFMELVKPHVPLNEARLATLGGHGIEAVLWSQLGVPPEHGWLIELNRVRGLKLIAAHTYRMVNRLSGFHAIVSGHDDAYIDGFHLDLCGTMGDDVIADFAPTLGLILRSRAKCLAITVADQRKNMILENWPEYLRRGHEVFGREEAPKIHAVLLEQQKRLPSNSNRPAHFHAFDPLKAAKREFGLLVGVAEMLKKHPAWTPTMIERYIYISRYAPPQPWRMRTYLFRFERRMVEMPALVERWLASPLYIDRNKSFVDIKDIVAPPVSVAVSKKSAAEPVKAAKPKPQAKPIQTLTQETKGGSTMSKLAEIVSAVNKDDVTKEYTELVESKKRLDSLLQALEGVVRYSRRDDPSQGPASSASQQQGAPYDPKAQGPAPKNGKRFQKEWDSLSEAQRIEWLFKALEVKAEAGNEWLRKYPDLLRQDFGHYTPEFGRSMSSRLAHTSGKFRDNFVRKIKDTFGDRAQAYIDRLTRLK